MAGETVQTLQCPQCAASVAIHLPGTTITVACSACGTIVDPNHSAGARIVQEGHEKVKIKPAIPFGTKGEIAGKKWMCLGLIIKKDVTWSFRWREYLLYNPQEGFRWLTESDDHWTFVNTLKAKPKSSVDDEIFFRGHECLNHQGRNFRLFHRGKSEVVFCLGEFYWRVKRGEQATFADFVRPGEIISHEKSAEEDIYSYGYYLTPDEVRKAFGVPDIPDPYKSAPHEPTSYSEHWPQIKKMWAAFTGALFVGFLMAMFSADNARIGANSFMTLDPAGKSTKVAEFGLGSTQNIEVVLEAPVSNNWFEVAYTLVNRQTGDSMEFDQGVEYYFGRDSDGAWSEGSPRSEKIISALPAGDYELLAQSVGSSVSSYSVAVNRDVTMYSNFIWALIFITLYPLLYLWRMQMDVASKWRESDYSPFPSSEDDDDD